MVREPDRARARESALLDFRTLVHARAIPGLRHDIPPGVGMRCEIAHASRGRLRVRYPVSWLRHRRGDVETRLRALPGVRGVSPSTTTGSVRIDYDPFRLAERALIDALVLASEIPAVLRGAAAVRRRRLDGHVLEAATLLLLTARGDYLSSAL